MTNLLLSAVIIAAEPAMQPRTPTVTWMDMGPAQVGGLHKSVAVVRRHEGAGQKPLASALPCLERLCPHHITHETTCSELTLPQHPLVVCSAVLPPPPPPLKCTLTQYHDHCPSCQSAARVRHSHRTDARERTEPQGCRGNASSIPAPPFAAAGWMERRKRRIPACVCAAGPAMASSRAAGARLPRRPHLPSRPPFLPPSCRSPREANACDRAMVREARETHEPGSSNPGASPNIRFG